MLAFPDSPDRGQHPPGAVPSRPMIVLLFAMGMMMVSDHKAPLSATLRPDDVVIFAYAADDMALSLAPRCAELARAVVAAIL